MNRETLFPLAYPGTVLEKLPTCCRGCNWRYAGWTFSSNWIACGTSANTVPLPEEYRELMFNLLKQTSPSHVHPLEIEKTFCRDLCLRDEFLQLDIRVPHELQALLTHHEDSRLYTIKWPTAGRNVNAVGVFAEQKTEPDKSIGQTEYEQVRLIHKLRAIVIPTKSELRKSFTGHQS